MRSARLPWSAAIIVAAVLAAQAPVWGAPSSKDARRVYDEATAAFGLGRYAEAAEKYEAAFSLRPIPRCCTTPRSRIAWQATRRARSSCTATTSGCTPKAPTPRTLVTTSPR